MLLAKLLLIVNGGDARSRNLYKKVKKRAQEICTATDARDENCAV